MPTNSKTRCVKTNQSSKPKREYSQESQSTDDSLRTSETKPTITEKRISQQTVSIQYLQFPDLNPNKPGTFKVKCQRNELKRPESNTTSTAKERGYDFTSSTNSYFAQMLLVTVPKRYGAKSSSSTTLGIRSQKQPSSETLITLKPTREQHTATSEQMIDSKHQGSEKPKQFHGAEWSKPCKESFVAGAPRKFTGTCPPNYEQLSKMSKTRQKFFLTQDPRKVQCLVNPEVLRSKEYSKRKEFNALTKMVKHAQNVCAATASETSEDFICEVIDLENPLQLDFQGLDYSNTYQKDEQDLQNQRNYRRVCRYMERRRVKAETQRNVEEKLHEEMINIPKRFDIRDRNEPEPLTPPENIPKLGKLYRSADKPCNQKLINLENERRRQRYKDLYLRNKERQEQQKLANEVRKKVESENLALTLADTNLKKLVSTIDESIERCAGIELKLKTLHTERRTFPHTMHETKLFKRDLKRKNLIKRYRARVTKEFFEERKGKLKEFPAAELEVSSELEERSVADSKLTEQSTDDEDNLEVGKQADKFKLRGFQFKMDSKLRGKLTQRERQQGTRKEKICITRDQWLKELAPKKQQIKLDVEMGIQKLRTPDDPQLVLFPPPFGFKQPQAQYSTIKEYIQKPLGRHYDLIRRKNLKFAKPRLRYNVKKFNLISYRFGDTAKRFAQLKDPLADAQILKLKTTNEFMAAKALREKRRREELKQRRLKLLGIPCRPVKKSRLQTKCENSSTSSDSDWVPQQEPLEEDDLLNDNDLRPIERSIKPLRLRGNMPAPKYREPTLRQHPRNPRDYNNLRVPSAMFDQIVLTTNLPYMQKLDKDQVDYANVEQQKRPYTDKFESRHHHDHWKATQVKQVDVHYQPHLVQAEITKIKKKSDRVLMENFRMANPPCNQFVDMELSMPQYDLEEMIEQHQSKRRSGQTKTNDSGLAKTQANYQQKDYKLQTRDPKELENLDYPGRQEYLQLLKDTKELYKECEQLMEVSETKLYVNKAQLYQELEEDLKSIESCLTSLSSSNCTNLTNDSGSFLLMEGKEKIPLDFIRKSIVPFEELQRSHFQAEPIDVDREQKNPFQVLPFAGQKKAQLELATAKDSFFTFNTRLKNGLRMRLEVKVEDVRDKLLGQGSNKHKGVVATDIEENYVEELKNRPAIKQFKFKTGAGFIKDALRLKFESMLIQGQMVRTKIYDRLNEQHWCDMQRVKELFEKLFAKWEKREYDAAMAVVYKVKNYYDESDRLKTELKNLERELVIMNMDIVFIEGHWVRCVMLQNFHYLMGDQEWRLKNDWIHRLEAAGDDEVDDELENFEVSIAKRSTMNIRQRDKDDAWAIKAFYEEEYLRNKHNNLIVFPNAESFLEGLENLKSKTFVLLLEMHFTFDLHTELQYKLEAFMDWCAEDLHDKEQFVNRKCAKLYFMSDRAKWLNQRSLNFLQEPIEECFNDISFQRDRAIIREAWRRIVPATLRGSEQQLYTIEMVAMMSEVVMELIAKFETIPMTLAQQTENKLRKRRAYLRKQSHQAYHIERRIDMEMKKVVKNLEPPYQKSKRPSKLPRYYIKKRAKTIKIEEKKISERAKFFFRAFHEDDLIAADASDFKDSISQVDSTQEQIVPFYFDHFLKLNGYTPNYNFKTQVELRDGSELDRLQVKTFIPEIQERMEQWEVMKRKIMEDNIAQNPKMYIDVMT